MKASDKLRLLVGYYDVTRSVGHTELMANGVLDTPGALVVAHNSEYAGKLMRAYRLDPSQMASLTALERINGRHSPLAFDNFALRCLFIETLSEITELLRETNQLRRKIADARRVLNDAR